MDCPWALRTLSIAMLNCGEGDGRDSNFFSARTVLLSESGSAEWVHFENIASEAAALAVAHALVYSAVKSISRNRLSVTLRLRKAVTGRNPFPAKGRQNRAKLRRRLFLTALLIVIRISWRPLVVQEVLGVVL